jgi:hypothetical protein
MDAVEKMLKSVNITTTLCLGTKLSMTTYDILTRMSLEQIIKMFDENADAQYILLDGQGSYSDIKKGATNG